MNIVINAKTKIIATGIVAAFVLGFLLWEYFHGGVVSHHLFHNQDLPKVSNWWSILSIPLLTWILLSLIQKRQDIQNQKVISKSILYGFFGAFLFGIVLTVLFYHAPSLPNYLLLLTFAFALFVPIYRPEYYLGFILSMTYGFGGILPVIIGLFLIAIYALEFLVIRRGFLGLLSKIR